ncbi:MAG: hypothetical protein GX201_07865 [Clostridiales bacterium]|nr:hypothetical protein [Clostridiales bacterium]
MLNKKTLIAAILVLTVFVVSSCTGINKPAESNNSDVESGAEEIKQGQIMEQYEKLMSQKTDIREYISFADENIEFLSEENAAKLIIQMEELQKEYLDELENEYYCMDQSILFQLYEPEYNLANLVPENVEDEEVKRILKETYELGYKVDTSEGIFFPIIDYSFYEKYSQYLTEDMKDYIGIMAVESDKMPAKDAGLVISWEEVLERAFNQESFLEKHKDSVKYEDIKNLYNKYVSFIVYGIDNTPLFKHVESTMNDEAKIAYQNSIDKDSNLSRILKEYYEVIEREGFKLTDNVKKFRDEVMKKF